MQALCRIFARMIGKKTQGNPDSPMMTEVKEGTTPEEAPQPPPVETVEGGKTSEEIATELENHQRQQDEIRAEVVNHPLVGDRIPFDCVVMEYDEDTGKEFRAKALELSNAYESVRQIRKDGNCFYRAFLSAQIEIMCNDPDERKRFISVCKGWRDRLLKLGYAEFTTTDFCDTFYEFLDTLVENKRSWTQIMEEVLREDNQANYLIIFLRLVAAGYLRENQDDFAPFIDGERSYLDYCAQEVEQMWVDVDHLAITAFIKGIGTPIRIEYMDRGAAPDGGTFYEFPEASEQPFPPRIRLLYRPGHYDIIYPRE